MTPFATLLQIQLPDADNPLDVLSSVSFGNIVWAGVILFITWLIVRFMQQVLGALARRAPRARFFFKWLDPLAAFTFWSLGAFAVISIFAPSPETMIAVLASVGIALGFGAQELVKNIIGGLVILVDRPYQLGDRVRFGDAYGEVDHVGLRSTKITTADDTRVTIPNSEVLTGKVWNSNSGVPDCQVVTDLYLPHDVDPEAAIEVGLESAYCSPYLLLTKPVFVNLLDGFDQRPYLILRIKSYVYDHKYEPKMMSDITTRAKKELRKRGMLSRGYSP